MAKVNYQFQKAERERAKLAKKEAKRREEMQRSSTPAEAPAAEIVQDKAPVES
ncbi:hypothetical protein [Acidisphaera sp. L21]|jgi:hypothetical protein|uniref:hypothetical protein n=1 Tax=Acidisphaera sp. L21 TaxID=1641851 RepID=UPI001575DA0F|nr:hypothetical protein [Acidisphaera sp. L21]